jgi:ribonuclease HII
MLKSFFDKNLLEAGCDEAGRGCLAGPVFAAAVILPKKYRNNWLNDSKQLKEEVRYELREEIQAKAEHWAVANVSNTEIDEINILQASFLSMHRALDQLPVQPQLLLIDGNRFKAYKQIQHKCIIKGDGKYLSIAAASILAKTYRDDFMKQAALVHPEYGWLTNKGYGTLEHRQAIETHGTTPLHRLSFQLLQDQYELELD